MEPRGRDRHRREAPRAQENEDLTQPPYLCDRVMDYLFKTVCGAASVTSSPPRDGLAVASWALTLCRPALSPSICPCWHAIFESNSFCCRATVARKSFVSFSTLRCSLRNSFSNIALTAS